MRLASSFLELVFEFLSAVFCSIQVPAYASVSCTVYRVPRVRSRLSYPGRYISRGATETGEHEAGHQNRAEGEGRRKSQRRTIAFYR